MLGHHLRLLCLCMHPLEAVLAQPLYNGFETGLKAQ